MCIPPHLCSPVFHLTYVHVYSTSPMFTCIPLHLCSPVFLLHGPARRLTQAPQTTPQKQRSQPSVSPPTTANNSSSSLAGFLKSPNSSLIVDGVTVQMRNRPASPAMSPIPTHANNEPVVRMFSEGGTCTPSLLLILLVTLRCVARLHLIVSFFLLCGRAREPAALVCAAYSRFVRGSYRVPTTLC